MAKKDKDKKSKKKDKNGSQDTVEAVRSAVERTFQATAEGAQAGRGRAQDLVHDVTAAAAKVRELFEESRVLEDLKGLRREVELLARRVADLELRGRSESAPAAPAAAPARKTPARRSTTARKAPARSTATARKAGTGGTKTPAAKSTGTRSTASKPAAKRASTSRSTAAKSGTSRSRSSAPKPSGSESPGSSGS